jgi:hypothetical protein
MRWSTATAIIGPTRSTCWRATLRGPAVWPSATAISTWRPSADVLVMPDGSLLVSDDKAGRIYRITYAPGA